jgi:hypothetical protein
VSTREVTFSFVNIACHVSNSDTDKGKRHFPRKSLSSGKPSGFKSVSQFDADKNHDPFSHFRRIFAET